MYTTEGTDSYLPRSRQFTTLSRRKFYRSHSLVYKIKASSSTKHQDASNKTEKVSLNRRSAEPLENINFGNYRSIQKDAIRQTAEGTVHLRRAASQKSAHVTSVLKRLLSILRRCCYADNSADLGESGIMTIFAEGSHESIAIVIEEYAQTELETMCHFDEVSVAAEAPEGGTVHRHSLAQELVRSLDEASAFSPIAAAFVYSGSKVLQKLAQGDHSRVKIETQKPFDSAVYIGTL